jgi:hypothetical protein
MVDPRPDRRGSDRPRSAVLVVNGLGTAAAAAFAAAGLARPDYARPATSVSSLTRFWSAASAVRTWSLSAPLLIALMRERRSAPELLRVAGLVQLGDSALGIWQRNPRMAIFPAAMGLVHLTSARSLSAPPEGSIDRSESAQKNRPADR